jgi:ATP-binding cassette subfamily C protein
MRAEFRDAIRVLRPVDKRATLILAALSAVSVLLEVLGIMAVAPLMAFLAGPDSASSHLSVQIIERIFHPQTSLQTLLLLFLVLMGIFVAKNVYFAGLHFVNYRFARAGSIWLSRQLLELYFYRSVERERRTSISDAIRNIRETGSILYFTIVVSFVNLIAELLVILGIGLLLLWVQVYAALAAGILMAIAIALQYYLYGHKVRDLGARVTSLSQDSYRSVLQALHSHKEIRLRGKEEHFIERLLAQQVAETTYRQQQRLLYAVSGQVTEIIMLVAISIVIAIIILLSGEVFAAFSTVAVFAAAALRLTPTVNRLIHAVGELQGHGSDIRVLATELEARQKEIPIELAQGKAGPLRLERELRVTGLIYRYPDKPEPALRGIDLTIRRGEFIGLVGPSGAGKSTFADVLMALIAPSEGDYEADGQSVWSNPRGLRALVGYVPQSIYLFDDTMRRNIAFGESDSEIDDDRIWAALHLAQLDTFVRHQPNGLDTLVGEGGSSISGGERQRIGIARALYHRPEILVLDEATSQLDTETEYALAEALGRLKGTMTIIVIAHRLSTVKNCDRVVLMKGGQVVDAAPFLVLADRNSDFARIVALASVGMLPDTS